jgi:two-component system phosphate regulon sensor histidine kinase PhoR
MAGAAADDAAAEVGALVAALGAPAIVLDAGGVDRLHNGAAAALFPALAAGEPISFSVRVPELLDAVRRVGGGAAAERVGFVQRVPVERWLEAQVAPLAAAADGTPPDRMLVQVFETTEARLAERMRVEFVANASHELRTPLASLLGFIETLQGPARDDSAARARFLEIMRGRATRMARLIDDLLSLSRIERQRHIRPDTPVALAPIVAAVGEALATIAGENDATLDIGPLDDQVTVLGDRDELFRVFENLMENAIKYGRRGGTVTVMLRTEAREGADEVEVAVRDEGPGIAPAHLPRLTERFYRIDAGVSRAKGGTGLGLAIVKHILARHRGRLQIASTPGEGATFTAVLPRHPTAGAAPGEAG